MVGLCGEAPPVSPYSFRSHNEAMTLPMMRHLLSFPGGQSVLPFADPVIGELEVRLDFHFGHVAAEAVVG